MKQTFNINRFWQVLKWTVLTEKKSIFTAAVAFLVAFLVIQLFSCFTFFDITRSSGPAATFAAVATCGAILSFMHCYYASGMLGNARSSQQRTTALMLPASNMEKFLARLVYCCILMPLLLYVMALAATGLRVLFELIASHENITSGFSILFDAMNINGNGHQFGTFFEIAFTCWSVSIFVLGGILIHQRPFVWTTVALVVGSILFVSLVYYVGTLIGEDNIKDFLRHFKGMTLETFEIITSLVFLAFTILNVWLGYRLFCRLQVVQHKWFNV